VSKMVSEELVLDVKNVSKIYSSGLIRISKTHAVKDVSSSLDKEKYSR